jgi:peptidoglycan/xylan/chitin deacetylase (PgdA/CDA1 family)
MPANQKVLLSFDIEEFDVPVEDYGVNVPFEEQIRISANGTLTILDILHEYQIKATFFSTVTFAVNAPQVIQRIVSEGHELASHGWFHSTFADKDLLASRNELTKISGIEVKGFRMARMMEVNDEAIREAGYVYNSSLNPVYLPGRYNNFGSPRTIFKEHGLVQLPASATPFLRVPLFWLSFHHLPLWYYKAACKRTMRRDGYLNIYFHPWEFTDISDPKLGLPWLIKKNSGADMISRFRRWVDWTKAERYSFDTLIGFVSRRSF